MAKKISDATIDRLKSISPDELVAHSVIQTAPNHKAGSLNGYCCPLCHSGERSGTGAAEFDSDNWLYCHACNNTDNGGHKLSAIDLFAIARNMQHDGFGKIVRAMADEFGIRVEDEDFDMPITRRKNKLPPPSPPKAPTDERELELIRADLSVSDESLKQFVESCGGKWRELPTELLAKFGCRYSEKWAPPKSRVNGKFATPTPRILIPSGDDFYLARFVGNTYQNTTMDTYKVPVEALNGYKSDFTNDAIKLLCSLGFNEQTAQAIFKKCADVQDCFARVNRAQSLLKRQKKPVENELGFLRKAIEEDWQIGGESASRRNGTSSPQQSESNEEAPRLKPKNLRVGRQSIPYGIAKVYIQAIRNNEHLELVRRGLKEYNVTIEKFTKLCEKHGL